MSATNGTSIFTSLLASPIQLLLDPKSWYPPPTRAISPRSWFLPLILSSFIVSSFLSRRIRLWIATPTLLLLISQTRVSSTGDVAKDFGTAAFVFGIVMKWVDFAMLVKDGEIWRVEEKNSQAESEKGGMESSKEGKAGSLQRLKNVIDIWIFNMRGIGWNWRVGGIPDRAPQSRGYFLFRTALRILGSFLALDICKFLSAQFPYIHTYPRPSFFAQPILVQVALTWLHQLEAFTFFNIPYQTLAFLAILTNFQSPKDWPPLFGSLSDSYLVSHAWGRTWHQLVRRPLGLLTPYAQRSLGTKSRGAKRTVSLFCSFLMSGISHWSGAVNLPWTPSSWGMFGYFMIQAPVIRMEDLVVDYGKEKGIKGNRMLKLVGCLWTFAWISFSMRYAAAFQFESGPLSKFELLGFSLVDLVVRKLMSSMN